MKNSTSERSEAVCKVPNKIASKVSSKIAAEVPSKIPSKLPTNFRNYTPKIRQQVISNKLLNSKLYELYTVRKLLCAGAWLKANIVDGTITIEKQIYIVSWLGILPTDAYKEEAVVISLRTSKYKDIRTGEYPHSYAVVSKIVE